jgi:hypothetical protein
MKIDQTASCYGRRVIVWLCLAALLGLGLEIYRDYGISFDEGISRDDGHVSLAYVLTMLPKGWQEALTRSATLERLRSVPPLHEYFDRDYGVVFELPAALGEYVFGIQEERDVYLYRHLLTFLVCSGGVVAVYQLVARRFRDWHVGLLGALMLVLSPRLFADSFYNSKDAVFLAFFAIGLNTLVCFLLSPTRRRAAVHALACALAIDVRIMAVLLPVVTVALLVSRGLRGDFSSRKLWRSGLTYFGLLLVFITVMWPYLWEAPFNNFVQAFRNMTHFRWDGEVLYRGEMVRATQLPWHYALVWVGITTPPLYLLAFGAGLVAIGGQLIRNGWRLYRCDEEWQDLLFLTTALGPVVSVIVLHSVLYDGWRQLYFIYPAFVLVAVRGLVVVLQWQSARRYWRVAVTSLVAASLLFTAGQMVWLHPFEHVYFNVFAGRKNLERRYELDYWCLSYRQGLEWIVRHDDRPQIRVNFNPGWVICNVPGELNRLLLPVADRKRIVIESDATQADYVITNYRWHPLNYEYPREVARFFAGDLRILSVFRLR